jgi:hypothetical protein
MVRQVGYERNRLNHELNRISRSPLKRIAQLCVLLLAAGFVSSPPGFAQASLGASRLRCEVRAGSGERLCGTMEA